MGKFDRPPSAAGHAEFEYVHYDGMPLQRLASEGPEEAAAREEHNRRILRPVLDFLLLAAVLLPWALWWGMAGEQCWNPSSYKATEPTLLRVTRGVWIAWLTHAAGLLDEALRVFLGIRLTMGLGSPTSVDKTYTKMSRQAEIVAEGIAVDDFPALVRLYAGAEPPRANKRSSSGTARSGSGRIGGDDGTSYAAGLAAAARARVNKSLVMRVERIAATARLWSLVPWSDVRRYDRVHVKGITLRLRQVNGILNFSFLALKKKGRPGVVGLGGDAAAAGAPGGGLGGEGGAAVAGGGGRRALSFGGGAAAGPEGSAGVGAPGYGNGRSLEDLDGIDTDGEDTTVTEELLEDEEEDDHEGEEEEDGACYGPVDDADLLATAGGGGGGDAAGDGDAIALLGRRRARSSSSSMMSADEASLRSQSVTTSGAPGCEARRGTTPWAAAAATSTRPAAPGARSSHSAAAAATGTSGSSHHQAPGARTRSMSLSVQKRKKTAPLPSSENHGNLGVFKVLGEAFMRRFNAYSDQVSAAFDRVSDIKVVPKLWRWGKKRGPKRRKRFEVGEIFLEDVCICVDSGVWNDLLGDQVGAAFSPEFRLSVRVGPKELLTPNGKGRLPGDIGKLLNDKLVRLLARLVMRETLKTSTLTSVVITSLALDTDARGRRLQGKHNKSLSPPPIERGHRRHAGASETMPPVQTSAVATAAPMSTAATAGSENRSGKFWRTFTTHSSASSGAAIAAAAAGAAAAAAAAEAGGPAPSVASASLPRSSSGGSLGVRSANRGGGGGGRRQKPHSASGADSSLSVSNSSWSGFQQDVGGSVLDSGGGSGGAGGGGGDSRPGRRAQRSKRSLPSIGSWRRYSEPASSAALVGGKTSLSQSPPPRSRVRQRPGGLAAGSGIGAVSDGGGGGGGIAATSDEDEREDGEGVVSGERRRLPGRGRGGASSRRERRGTVSDVAVGGGGGAGDGGEEGGRGEDSSGGGDSVETVAKVPPWMEGVEASPEYEEMKPTLDVIKQTVLLAMLQQTNRSVDLSTEGFEEPQHQGDINAKHNGRTWGRRHASRSSSTSKNAGEMLELEGEDKRTLERRMQREIIAAEEAGGDVDRLVMKRLLAGVRDSGPDTAYKALASIELSSFIDKVSKGTRFAQHLDHLGIDVKRLSRSLSGLTAGEMMEGVKDTAGKVGDEARRLRTEAVRVQKELLDESGILPLLNDAGGRDDATSLAAAVGLLTDALSGEHNTASSGGGGGGGGSSLVPQDEESWERGVAVPNDPEEEGHSVESGLRSAGIVGGGGDLDEVDQVDVIMQVLDLIDAVERLKKSIVEGGVSLGKVEQAVGKVAQGIDVYLILAASESMLGFLLERLGKLPVGHAKFAGKGVEARVWNLDLEGVHVKRENVDLVMKGFRLPKRGTAVMTKFGPGNIKRYKKRSRCFVVNLNWRLGSGKRVKAYLQPNDIEILEGHEGRLSDEEEVKESGHTKVTVDTSEADASTLTPEEPRGSKSGGGDSSYLSPPRREHSNAGSSTSSAPSLPPPRAERGGRWPSLPRIWNRRKSAGAPQVAASAELGPVGVGVGDGGGGEGAVAAAGKPGGSGGQTMARRTASAPVLLLPSTGGALPQQQEEGDPSARIVSTEPLGEDLCSSAFVREAGQAETTSSSVSSSWRETAGATTSLPARENAPPRSGVVDDGDDGVAEDGRGFGEVHRRTERINSQGPITGPNSADVMSAPFLVARISGVGAELKDIMWAVKQTHFPYLRTQGSLQATLSGLTIELELDTQELPAGQGKKPQGSGSGSGGAVGESDSAGGVGSGGSGGSPTGLKLTRLRVSVLAVKVHVKNNALSAVYNLAASAFEAAVKRHVVENVEAAVRKNVTSLLTIINTQLGEKWNVLCKVGGGNASRGGGGGGYGGGDGSHGGEGRLSRAGSAVEKVLAASLSHHLVWSADGASAAAAAAPDGGGRAPAAAVSTSTLPLSDQPPPAAGQQQQQQQQGPSCGERKGSGSSRSSADADDVGAGSSGSSSSVARKASGGRKMTLGKRSFRILGSVGKAPSTEDMSKLSTPSSSSSSPASSAPAKSAASSSSSVPPPVSRVGSAAGGLPRSSSPPSRDTSRTTLSGEEDGSSGAPLAEGTGGKQHQHQHQHQQHQQQQRKKPAPVRARGMWASPLRKPQQPLRKGLRLDGNEAGDGGFVSDGFMARGQEQEEEEEMYWTPPNTMRTPAAGPIWVGNS